MPNTYCDWAYNEVMTWTQDTLIEYAPNKKSGKSYHRYEAYRKGKTVGESLALGSLGLDLLFDHEKGLVKAIGGPKRDRPPEVEGLSKQEVQALNTTDRTLGKMYAKWLNWKKNFALLEEHGMTRKELKEMNDAQDPEGGRDSIEVAIGRREAQAQAKKILAEADDANEGKGRAITDDEVLSCLRLWGFKENTNRGNVMPEGEKFVYSDTVGIIKMSTCERTLLTLGTKRYPEFTILITRWLRERLPIDLQQEYTYTSININKNYAGKLHRDGNNAGPSFIKAFGKWTGGELNYWPSDDKKLPLEQFDHSKKVTVDISDKLLLFDGNRGHYVNPFQGDRYSLVFFSVRTWHKIPQEEMDAARRCGIPIPSEASTGYNRSLLAPSGDGGYRTWLCAPTERGMTLARATAEEQAKNIDVGSTAPQLAAQPVGTVKEATATKAKRGRGRPAKEAVTPDQNAKIGTVKESAASASKTAKAKEEAPDVPSDANAAKGGSAKRQRLLTCITVD